MTTGDDNDRVRLAQLLNQLADSWEQEEAEKDETPAKSADTFAANDPAPRGLSDERKRAIAKHLAKRDFSNEE